MILQTFANRNITKIDSLVFIERNSYIFALFWKKLLNLNRKHVIMPLKRKKYIDILC